MARPVCKGFCRDRRLTGLLQRIRPRRSPPGQDGDTRAPVLINSSASCAVFNIRLPERRLTVRSHGDWVCGQSSDRVRSLTNHQLEAIMLSRADHTETSIRTDLRAIFVSLELSRTIWLVTSLSPGTREKVSKHSVPAGDIDWLLVRLRSLQERERARRKQLPPLVVIQEAGLEGFWIHRVLTENGIESQSSIRRRLPRHVGDGVQRPTNSMATHWFAPCSRTNAVSQESAQWCDRRPMKKRTGADYLASAGSY